MRVHSIPAASAFILSILSILSKESGVFHL